jgi:outer membrane protein TolC
VRQAGAALAKMRALRAQADAARFPHVEFLGAAGAPVPEAKNDPERIDAVTPASRLGNGELGQAGYLLHFSAQLAQPVYTFGKIDAYRSAAQGGVAASEAMAAAASAQSARDAAEAFWSWQLAREIASGIDGALRAVAEARTKVERLLAVKSPQASQMDLAKLEMLALELEARKAEAVAGLALATEAARLLAGVPDATPFALAEAKLDFHPLGVLPVERYLDAAATARPELGAARAALRARRDLALAAERALLPDLLIVGQTDLNYSNATTRQTNPFAWDPYNSRTAGLGLVLRGTLDVMQKRAGAEEAAADAEQAAATLDLAEKAVRLEVVRAFGAVRSTAERAALTRKQVAAARRWLTAAQLGFDAGAGEVSDVLAPALALAYAEGAALSAARDAEVALAALDLAVGTGARGLK